MKSEELQIPHMVTHKEAIEYFNKVMYQCAVKGRTDLLPYYEFALRVIRKDMGKEDKENVGK